MLHIPWLDPEDFSFPPIDQAMAEPSGLLAAGGDLSPDRLVAAYRRGIFPWYEQGQPILWWSPDPRMVLRPKDLHISRSTRKFMLKQEYVITLDKSFESVVRNCAQPGQTQQGTWITDEMVAAYIELHKRGIAHSVEVWLENKLVGGLYGLGIGQLFFGESMFSLKTNASKIGFLHLVKQLDLWQYSLIDCQISSNHLANFGAIEISRQEFQVYLDKYLDKPGQKDAWCLTLGSKRNLPSHW